MSAYIVNMLVEERDRLEEVISILQSSEAPAPKKRLGRPPATVDPLANAPDWVLPKKAPAKKKGGMSAAGRKAISDATKARWAKLRAEKAEAVAPKVSKKKSAIMAAVTPSAEDAEFKSKMSIAMKKAWAKRKKAAKKS